MMIMFRFPWVMLRLSILLITFCDLKIFRDLSMAVLSRHWPAKTFVVVDRDVDIINNINGENEENDRSNIAAELDLCRMIFIAVDIPLKVQPDQVKSDFDVQNWEEATRAILESIGRAPVLQSKYVAAKSTLPLDFKRDIRDRFPGYNNFSLLHIITNPEFSRMVLL